IQTLLGVPFQVNSDAQIIAVGNTSNIIATDISASNGIIHVIDQVLLPIN
ncbi:MAG: fasciclin domain-containing protein, partial [Flavobacteriaceae bacterium]|nr:fasciclin domain-containing protein [Flavobacteriaceae bacterium]